MTCNVSSATLNATLSPSGLFWYIPVVEMCGKLKFGSDSVF